MIHLHKKLFKFQPKQFKLIHKSSKKVKYSMTYMQYLIIMVI